MRRETACPPEPSGRYICESRPWRPRCSSHCSLRPRAAAAQEPPPPATSFEKVTLNDFPGEPMNLAVLPDGRVLHTTRQGEVRIHDPRRRAEHAGGDAGRLPARRGRPAERRDRPELREQPVGLRVLLAAAEHAGRTTRTTPVTQRGRRAGERHRRRLRASSRASSALSRFKLKGDKIDLEDRAEDPGRAGRSRHVLPRRRQHRLRQRGQPVPVARATTRTRSPRTATRRSTTRRTATRSFDARRSAGNTNDLRGKILRIQPEGRAAATRSRRATCSAQGTARRPSPRSTRWACATRSGSRSTATTATSTSATTRRTPTRPTRCAARPATAAGC